MKDRKPYEVVYEDKDVLVVYKKRDVLTVKTEDPKTFHHNLYYYLKKDEAKKGEQLSVLHRLDYETSGLIVFPKSDRVHSCLQMAFGKRTVIREYEAVVKEEIPLWEEYEVHQLLSGTRNIVSGEEGKEAITSFTATNRIGIGTALKISIKTGRKNQIRISLHDSGLTLLGDRRYSKSEAKRMYLNHYRIVFPEECGLKKREFSVPPLWMEEQGH